MRLLVAFAIWTIGFLAVVEYLLHRHIMHRPHRNPLLWEAFHTHAVLHHQDARNDLNIDAEPAYNLLLGSPVIALVLGVGWLTGDPSTLLAALVIAGLIVGYSLLWTGLHRSMHGVGGRWATHLPGYAALRAHHLAHHRHAGRNFGTVFGSLMDRICGTHLLRRNTRARVFRRRILRWSPTARSDAGFYAARK